MQDENSHSIKQDKDSHQYRIHFISLQGKYLCSTDFSDQREEMIYVTDVINSQCKSIRARIETRATGFANVI